MAHDKRACRASSRLNNKSVSFWASPKGNFKVKQPRDEAQCLSSCSISARLVSSNEGGCLFQADAVHERIGMPMHEPPFGSFTAKDLCDTQRPVLLWQPADLAAHPFDRDENDEIA